jgi:hypothetical protein
MIFAMPAQAPPSEHRPTIHIESAMKFKTTARSLSNFDISTAFTLLGLLC